MARLAKLATAKPVAQVGATIGREFVVDMLRVVGGFEDKMLVDELNKLVAAGLLYRRGLLSRAKYIFKHALVQEALQQSLLKKQRRQYHKIIAEVLEEKFKEVVEAQPELVAYHYDEAGDTPKAVQYWHRAAERALRQCANREAVSHARRAIDALAALPDDEQRRMTELALLTIEGPALLALKGWAAPEVGACYHRAVELCRILPPTPKFFGVLRGIWKNHMVAARLKEAIALAGELFEIGFKTQHESLLLEGRAALCDTLFWMGRPADALEQGRLGLKIYDFDRHHASHSLSYGEDPATMLNVYSTLSLAVMGRARESLELARTWMELIDRFTHTHSRAFLIAGVAWNHAQLRNPGPTGEWADKLIAISTEHSFESWGAIGRALKGWSIAAQGDLEKGIADFAKGRQQWHATGARVKSCFYAALPADLLARAGDADRTAEWVAIGFEAASICDDRCYFSELHRLDGEVHAMRGDDEKAIRAYDQAIAIAGEQEARLLALRAATSLARLRMKRGERDAAAAVLAPLLAAFEHEDVPDVVEAREVLAKVGPVAVGEPKR
jgi:predicted ATPase